MNDDIRDLTLLDWAKVIGFTALVYAAVFFVAAL